MKKKFNIKQLYNSTKYPFSSPSSYGNMTKELMFIAR